MLPAGPRGVFPRRAAGRYPDSSYSYLADGRPGPRESVDLADHLATELAPDQFHARQPGVGGCGGDVGGGIVVVVEVGLVIQIGPRAAMSAHMRMGGLGGRG